MRANEAISSEFLLPPPPSPPNSADRADSLFSGKANNAARTTYTHTMHMRKAGPAADVSSASLSIRFRTNKRICYRASGGEGRGQSVCSV